MHKANIVCMENDQGNGYAIFNASTGLSGHENYNKESKEAVIKSLIDELIADGVERDNIAIS